MTLSAPRILFVLSLALLVEACSSSPKKILEELAIPATSLSPDQWANQKLLDLKITIPLQYQVTNPLTLQIIKLNVLGFLYQPDYSKQDSREALDQCAHFIKRNRKTLHAAEQKLGVSKEVITALLWVETRFGKRTGSYPLTNVFYQLIKADHPEMIQASLEELLKKRPDADFALKKKCVDRSATKANWALEQLKATARIHRAESIRASYAGAFGIPQFIPTSYFKFALSAKPNHDADLFNTNDAIFSVGNFLALNGWKQEDVESHAKALYEYNRSKDYGAIILQLAGKLK